MGCIVTIRELDPEDGDSVETGEPFPIDADDAFEWQIAVVELHVTGQRK